MQHVHMCIRKRESPFIAILQEILSDLHTHVCMTQCVCQSMRVHVSCVTCTCDNTGEKSAGNGSTQFVKRFGSKSLPSLSFFLIEQRDLFLTFA